MGFIHIKCPQLRLRRLSKENAGCHRADSVDGSVPLESEPS